MIYENVNKGQMKKQCFLREKWVPILKELRYSDKVETVLLDKSWLYCINVPPILGQY